MYPELFRIGNFPINTYGVLLAVGLLLALFTAAQLGETRRFAERKNLRSRACGRSSADCIGSKILMFFTEPNVNFFSLDFLRSGGVYYGGFLGGLLAVAILIPLYKLIVLESFRRFCAGRCARTIFRAARLFFGGLLLGQMSVICRGACILPKRRHENTGVPIYGPDGRRPFSASDAALRIFCDARRFRHFGLSAPQEKI